MNLFSADQYWGYNVGPMPGLTIGPILECLLWSFMNLFLRTNAGIIIQDPCLDYLWDLCPDGLVAFYKFIFTDQRWDYNVGLMPGLSAGPMPRWPYGLL